MPQIYLQIWGGIFALLNKICIAASGRSKTANKSKWLITAWILLVAAFFSCSSGSDIHIADIYCEGLPDPSGVSINSARFSWVMESQARNRAQSAYRIGISSSAKKLGQHSFDIYSSGFIF